MPPPSLFHLAVPVDSLEEARGFYGDLLGLEEGRSSETWIDYNFYGHQFVVHLGSPLIEPDINGVDGDSVPSFHYGAILMWDEWQALAQRLETAQIKFIIEPKIRFQGQPGEQATMFFKDPAGNALEFKSFRDRNQIFAK
ncbi:VOC family protein [Temperatibacter marinus]